MFRLVGAEERKRGPNHSGRGQGNGSNFASSQVSLLQILVLQATRQSHDDVTLFRLQSTPKNFLEQMVGVK